MRALALCALGLVLAACAARGPGRALYQWSDEQGNVRYTTSPGEVPRAWRHTLARIEPGRSAEANAALSPGARTQPRSEPSATEWLRGEAAAGAVTQDAAAEATGPAPGAATPEEIEALDAAIRSLEMEIAAAEVALAEQIGASEQGAGVREASERLPRLEAELLALRERRAAVAPDDGG